MEMERISVIIPLYNKEKAIRQCLESVLSQGDCVREIIVVDDGSTDKSPEIVAELQSSKIKYYRKSNGGVSSARNYGIKKAQTKWVFFLDADDLLLESAIESLLFLASKYPSANVCTANCFNVEKGRKRVASRYNKEGIIEKPIKALFEYQVIPRTGCTIYSKQLLEHVGGFDERISIFEDTEFDLRVLKKAVLAYSPYPIYEHLLDYSELGRSIKPLNKFWAYYIDSHHCEFYEKMMQMRILDWTYIKFIGTGDALAIRILKKKILRNIFSFLIYKLYSKLFVR